jgi:hypothetical protein
MGGGKGGGGGRGYVGRRFNQMPEYSGHRPDPGATPRTEGGGNSSPPTGPSAGGGSSPTKGSVATGQKSAGYTGKMAEAMAARAGKYGAYAVPLGPMATALAAAAGAYHEKSILDGEMSEKGRFGAPTISARPGGYKSLLGDDDDEGGGIGGFGADSSGSGVSESDPGRDRY